MRSAVKTRLYLAPAPANADLNLAADDRRTERFNHACLIVLDIENNNQLFFVLWKLHSKSTWRKNLRGLTLNGHDASGCTSVPAMLTVLSSTALMNTEHYLESQPQRRREQWILFIYCNTAATQI